MKGKMEFLVTKLNGIIFFLSIAGILWVLIRQDRDYTKAAQHKASVETAALRKYQHLERLFTNTQSSLNACGKKYDAILELSEQVNKDCDALESSVELLKKRQDILNSNQKILNKRNEKLQKILAEKKLEIKIDYIESKKSK